MVVLYAVLLIMAAYAVVSVLFLLLPGLSPIPFFPTQRKDIPIIVKEISMVVKHKIKPIIIDFGAGTGTVLFPLAQDINRSDVLYTAVEIHPFLTNIMNIRRMCNNRYRNISIVRKNMFTLTYEAAIGSLHIKKNQTIIFYLYVGKQYISEIKDVLKTYPKGTIVFSYMYDIPGWKNRLEKVTKGKKSLYRYSL